MKSIILYIVLFMVVCSYASAIDVQSKAFKIVDVKSDYIEVEFTLPTYKIEPLQENGLTYQRIQTDKNEYLSKTGFPELPIYSALIAIPYQGQAQLAVLSTEQKQINSFTPYPAQSKMEDGNSPVSFKIDQAFYNGSNKYPEQMIQSGAPQILRDFRVLNITMQPFNYAPDTKILTIQNKVTMRINIIRGNGENEMNAPISYSRSFEPLYRALIVNYAQVRDVALPYHPERILMIRPSTNDQTFLNKLDEFVNWKKQKGYEVTVATPAETGNSQTTIKTYIQNRYNSLETRPDYIILIGDVSGQYAIPTWMHSWAYYNGEGDYPYTHLAGTDGLGDVFIGRMSIESTSEFLTLVSKVFAYEKTTPAQPATWLNRMLLVGDDQSSGISTMYTNKFIKELSYAHNPNYTYNEVYEGSFPAAINSGVTQGAGFFNYRGYIGMSGWSPSGSIVNGSKLTHAVIITCDTGSFTSTSRTETFIRLGTPATPAGAITAIGMATSGTHTMLNNCLDGSIFEGLFTYDMHTMGQSLLYSKLYLDSTYGVSEYELSNAFAHICNLMGDPTVEVFLGMPSRMFLDYTSTIPNGSNMVEITVNDLVGHNIADVNVTLSQGSMILYNGISDLSGKVYATIPTNLSGQITVTASKSQFYPSIVPLTISTEGSTICDSQIIDDDNSGSSVGNNNGQANGGETIEFSLNLKNTGSTVVSALSGTLVSTDAEVQIVTATSAYSDISAGAIVMNTQPFVFSVTASVPDRKILHFTLQLSNGVNLPVLVEVRNADLDVTTTYINDNGNHVLDPGETAILNVTLTNNGLMPLSGLTGVLRSNSGLVSVEDTLAVFGDVTPGSAVNCASDAFIVHGQLQLVRGMKVSFTLDLSNSSGYFESETFTLNIGQVSVTDPLGPDDYGYLIYDMSDTGYPDAPDYNWIGIAPAESGSGTMLAFNDQGSTYDEGDDNNATSILPVSLPFTFSFYGVNYQSMSVCSNGFITFTNSLNGDFRNWHLPGALGPNAMIAAFWDDLIILPGAGVYTYFDSAQHRFIIEWYQAKNGYDRTSEETFQIILYDPSYYPTSTGDGQIKIQYKVFNNVDTGGSGSPQQGNYSTIGIKDHTGLRGIEYTFDNNYPLAAAPVSNQKALLITGIPILLQAPHLLMGELVLMDTNNNQVAEPGESINLGIRLSNMGLSSAQDVSATISSTDAYVTIQNATSPYDPIPGQNTGINKNFFSLLIAENCPNDHVITLVVDITAQGYTWQRFAVLRVTKPAISFGNTYINDMDGNNNGQANPAETIKIIMNIENTGTVDVENVNVSSSTTNANLIIANPATSFTRIAPGKVMQVILNVTLTQNAQVGTYIPISYSINASNTATVNGQFTIGVSTTGLFDNFEANNGDLISTSGWTWGSTTYTSGHSGRNMWGTSLLSEYPISADFTLTTPPMMIGSNSELKFWHKYSCEATYDGGNVSVSTNGGTTFSLLTPTTGYPSQSVSSLQEPCYSGTSMEWTQIICDLSQYANEQIIIRWHFCSDSMINGPGWFIDDVEISGFMTPTGVLQGTMHFTGEIPDLEQAVVHAGNFDTQPDASGFYKFYLPNGGYAVSEDMPSYESLPAQSILLNSANPIQTVDFTMNYLPGVTHLDYGLHDQHLVIAWNAPAQSSNQLLHYNILRRIDADRFQLVAEMAAPGYTEDCQIIGQYTYYITAEYQHGISAASDTITFRSDATGNQDDPVVPLKTVLQGNYPNPFNPETQISFTLAKSGAVKLEIYNVRGQLITVLVNESLNLGKHMVKWNGTDHFNHSVASGVYFYRLTTPGYTATKKALLLK